MPPKFARIPDSGDRTRSHDVERQALLDDESEEDDFFLKELLHFHKNLFKVVCCRFGADSNELIRELLGPRVNTNRLGDQKINRLRGQVDEVVDVMKDNVSKVVERGDRLEDLQDKSDNLASNSDMFRSRAKALHKTMWWKNCKMRLIMAFVIILILAVIIIPVVVSQLNKNKGG